MIIDSQNLIYETQRDNTKLCSNRVFDNFDRQLWTDSAVD